MEKGIERLSDVMRETHRIMTQLLCECTDQGKTTVESTVGEVVKERHKGKSLEEDDFLDDWDEGETSRHRPITESGRVEIRKLEMPVFDGSDPDSWLFHAEHFFQMQQFAEREKLKVAVVSFVGEVAMGSLGASPEEILKLRMFARIMVPKLRVHLGIHRRLAETIPHVPPWGQGG